MYIWQLARNLNLTRTVIISNCNQCFTELLQKLLYFAYNVKLFPWGNIVNMHSIVVKFPETFSQTKLIVSQVGGTKGIIKYVTNIPTFQSVLDMNR